MSRDRIVSVRMTEAEYAEVARLGKPTDVVRRALAVLAAIMRPAPPTTARRVPLRNRTNGMAWADGTYGANWPPVTTRSAATDVSEVTE